MRCFMSKNKVFMFVVSNSGARYSNVVRIDEENEDYCLTVSLTNPRFISYTAKINENDISHLFDTLKPVNEWGGKDAEKRELLDTTWFIYFNYGENTIRANGYKDFPDDYVSVANEISNWIISVLKKDNIELDDFSQEEFKKALTNKPHYIFSYYYYLPLSNICEYITIEEKNNVYFVDSNFDDAEGTKCKVEISKENIDKIIEILEPLIKCDDLKNRSIINDFCCKLMISYNNISFSVENFFNESINFNKMMLDVKRIICEAF